MRRNTEGPLNDELLLAPSIFVPTRQLSMPVAAEDTLVPTILLDVGRLFSMQVFRNA